MIVFDKPVFTIREIQNLDDSLMREYSIYADGRVIGFPGNLQVINRIPYYRGMADREGFKRGYKQGLEEGAAKARGEAPINTGADTEQQIKSMHLSEGFLRDFFNMGRRK